MKLFAHELKANVKSERPRHMIFFDVETLPGELIDGKIPQLFRYGEALYWRRGELNRQERLEWFHITELGSFWEWVYSKLSASSRLIVSSHNLNVDMVVTGAWKHLPLLGLELHSFYVQGMTVIIRFGGKAGTLVFLDNANWWKVKLETLGEMVGYPKLDVDPLQARLEELIPYCRRDVEILYQVWNRWFDFLDDHELGNWGITIASQALKTYTHRFMHYPIFIHANDRVVALERKSYHGGRVEPFWLGEWEEEARYKLDMNSMYPAVMSGRMFPTKLVTSWKSPDRAMVTKALVNHLLIMEVDLETDLPVYPVIGEGGVSYPIGRFKTTLTTPEVQFALAHGHLKDVGWCSVYERAPIFTEYIDYFYPLKTRYQEEGNRPYYESTKLMLNCLYGKFGQKGIEDKLVGSCDSDLCQVEPAHYFDTGEWGYLIYAGGRVIQRVEREAGYNTFVAIASHVTAYARMELWELITRAGRENVYYCDTDSLLVNRSGYLNLFSMVDSTALGALRLEDVATSGYIKGKKDYLLSGDRVLKGIPSRAREIDDGVFEFDMWPTMRGLLREGDLTQYYIKPVERKLKRELTWGWEGKEGRIFPLRLPRPVPPEEKGGEESYKLELELEGLLQARIFPQTLIFTLWDYREGELRKGAESVFYAPRYRGLVMDLKMQEFGFRDYNEFTRAIAAQVQLNARIKELRLRLRRLKV